MQRFSLLIILTVICFTVSGQSEDSTWFVNNYTKKEVYITMRDGIRLFTSIYIPKDNSKKHPFLMMRTPYSCEEYGESKYIQVWGTYWMSYVKSNYILVLQDVRGRYMSEGEFQDVRPFNKNKKSKKDIDEASDSYDAIDWMVKNIPNNNGNVGVFGTSYPGFYATEAALSGHPALKAVSPQAPVTDWFIGDDFHHKGAFFMMDAFKFYSSFGKPHREPMKDYGDGYTTPIKDNYKFYLQAGPVKNLAAMIGDSIKFFHELYKHPDYDDWWKARNARNGLFNVKPAMLWVGGLFDAEDCWGAWNSYKACEQQSPKTNNKIVMGPWSHGQWAGEGSYLGNIRFGSKTSKYYQDNFEIPFFKYYLEGVGNINQINEANIYFTGENTWKQFEVWPPANVSYKNMYINPGNKLSFDSSNAQGAYSEYISDPAHPVPYTEGIKSGRTKEYMNDDQRFASQRPDVLTFQMETLSEDLTLAGPVIADLAASISTTDADFVVKLIDVFPDTFNYDPAIKGNGKDYPMGGYEMLVRAEIMRGKYRNDFSSPQPFTPGTTTNVRFELPDIAHTFKKGHSIMIQIQSSWFPLVDRNPQKFVNIYNATEEDFQKCKIRIHYGPGAYTKFLLPIMASK